MQKVTLNIYNYGTYEVAKFNTTHDATECMNAFNDRLIRTYKGLPEKIFYYISCKRRNRPVHNVIGFTGCNPVPLTAQYKALENEISTSNLTIKSA